MLELSLLSYLAIAALTLLLFVSWKASISPVSKLPGPWHTIFTTARLLWEEFRGTRRTYIHELHEKYGPVVRIGPREVSFTSSTAIKEIYTFGGCGYEKTEFYTLFMQFGERTMFSTLGKRDHTRRKRCMAASYANTNIVRRNVLEGLQERADAFVKKCAEFNGGSVDVYVYLHCFALDCATFHIFQPYGTHSIEQETDRDMMEELSYHDSLKRDHNFTSPHQNLVDASPENLLQHHFPNFSSFLDLVFPLRPSPISNAYVQQACKTPSPATHTLLHALKSSKPPLSQLSIAAECMDHLAAGIDTTGDALCFLMYALSIPANQSIQALLISELNQNPLKSFDDLPYLDAVIKESLRLWPPIPMSQPRHVPEGGAVIDGHTLPAGTVVSAQAWSVHRLNEAVYCDGGDFVPERWLGGVGRVVDQADMHRCFFAFGAGARGCTGRHLAIVEMKTLLRTVYSQFSSHVAQDMDGDMELADQIISSRPKGQVCRLVFDELGRV